MMDVTSINNRARKKYGDEFDAWYATSGGALPIDKLPLDKVHELNKEFERDGAWGQVMIATNRHNCEWELGIEQMRGADVISFLLPEFQGCREIARLLSLRTRLAVAERRYDDAIESLRMNYRLGRDAAQQQLLVCGLIGIAVEGMANGTLTELLAAPDSPNLYWSLTELPAPLVDLQPAARFEMDFGPRMFPFIDHAETTHRAPQEWNRLFTQAILDFSKTGGGFNAHNSTEAGVTATGIALSGYSYAKERLIAQGMDRDRVEKMAVGQVIAIYTERQYRRFADDCEKLSYIPFADMDKGANSIEKRLAAARPFGGGEDREVFPVVSLLLPGLASARNAQVRLEREVASLRVIEALRMYAAENGGGLPARLDEIDRVPVPNNPATGKPFVYRLEGTTAILELPVSDHLASGNCRYEIQIAAKQK